MNRFVENYREQLPESLRGMQSYLTMPALDAPQLPAYVQGRSRGGNVAQQNYGSATPTTGASELIVEAFNEGEDRRHNPLKEFAGNVESLSKTLRDFAPGVIKMPIVKNGKVDEDDFWRVVSEIMLGPVGTALYDLRKDNKR